MNQTQMKASARKTAGGYKALIVHPDGRTEVLGGVWDRGKGEVELSLHHKAPTIPDRAKAIEFAQRTIDIRLMKRAINEWLYNNRDSEGRRRTEDDARSALGLPPVGFKKKFSEEEKASIYAERAQVSARLFAKG